MARRTGHLLIVLVLTGLVAAPACAQAPVVVAGAEQRAAFLAPVGEPAAINSPALFSPDGLFPGTPAWGAIKADIGFDYLQPHFTGRSTTLAVPAPKGGSVLGSTDNVSNDFAFVPRFGVEYDFSDLGFGVATGVKMSSLSGKLVRNVQSSAGNGNIIANGALDMAIVNLVEAVMPFQLDETRFCRCAFLNDCLFEGTVGSRYAHVRQHYDANLTVSDGGTASTGSLIANQLYDGFGLTTSLTTLYPLTNQLALYNVVRGSLLIGNNQRDSSINITAPMTPAVSAVVTENRTQLVPAGELEVGFLYGVPMPHRGPQQSVAPLLWVKAGLVGQMWGDIGLLRINDAKGSQFSDNHLFLYGFTVQVGLDY
jgi:Legionella pneumophila major outer membrane protein precursor